MNRELKFRAYNTETGEVFDVDFYRDAPILAGDVPEVVVMLSTNLKDENGREIYEGDILEQIENYSYCDGSECDTSCGCGAGQECYAYDEDANEVTRVKVVWNQYHAQFIGSRDGKPVLPDQFQYFRVVGNIYENPELLPWTHYNT